AWFAVCRIRRRSFRPPAYLIKLICRSWAVQSRRQNHNGSIRSLAYLRSLAAFLTRFAITIGIYGLFAGAQPHTTDAAAVGLQNLGEQTMIIERFAHVWHAAGIFNNEAGHGR